MWRLADRQIDEFVVRGECEFVHDYANPFTLLVIADLLGVPEADHEAFREELQGDRRPTQRRRADGAQAAGVPLRAVHGVHRGAPARAARRRDDELATATFPDGSLPEVDDVMLIAANLFAAGGETTARLLGTMLRLIGERPELQQLLRDERDRIPAFIEETLRLESPIQAQFRLARVPTTVGGVDLPAGTTVMVLNGAANRDPRQFDDPTSSASTGSNGRQHLGFGFGIHTCAGAPLARAEARVSLERILDRMGDIRISEAEHGPAGARRYEYTPIYMLRGLEQLHLEFTPRRADRAIAVTSLRREFRDELRAWLQEHPPPDVERRDDARKPTRCASGSGRSHAGRWVGIHWPVEYGGRGASLTQVAIYNEELARAQAPPLLGRAGVSLVGPTLMAHGTEEQRRRWMPRILAGDDVWCQLFSEPDAGSDLAGALDACREARRRLRRDRPEGVVVVRARSPTGASRWCAPIRTRRAQGHLDARDPDDGEGRRGPPAAPDHRRERVQRGLPRRRRGPGREPDRSRARGLARRRTRRSPTSAAPRSSGRSRCCTRWRSTCSLKACARAGRLGDPLVRQRLAQVVDRGRDLPPAQRAHARRGSPAARRSARSRAS